MKKFKKRTEKFYSIIIIIYFLLHRIYEKYKGHKHHDVITLADVTN